MTDILSNLHDKSQAYIETTPAEERHDSGQYFTPQSIISDLLDELPSELFEQEGLDILDPSVGTGEFLLHAHERYQNPNLSGWELDDDLVKIVTDITPATTSITQTNSLFHDPPKQYDLIIGNPPYYEITQSDKIKDHYDEILYGRTNIYSLFIYKSLEMLKEDGYLAFVVPPSMNNGAYFKELRNYIVENHSIEHLSVHENTELFDGATQSIMYLVIKCGSDHNKYVFQKDDITIFSEQADQLQQEFESKKTLDNLGYEVTTGRFMWNYQKEHLQETSSDDTTPFIYAKNITEGGLDVGEDVHNKPQYITNYESNTGQAIIVNRVIGQVGEGSIRPAIIPHEYEYIAENHTNVITPKEDEEQEIPLKEVYQQLQNDSNTEILQMLTGNTQLSKTELQYLFPFSV